MRHCAMTAGISGSLLLLLWGVSGCWSGATVLYMDVPEAGSAARGQAVMEGDPLNGMTLRIFERPEEENALISPQPLTCELISVSSTPTSARYRCETTPKVGNPSRLQVLAYQGSGGSYYPVLYATLEQPEGTGQLAEGSVVLKPVTSENAEAANAFAFSALKITDENGVGLTGQVGLYWPEASGKDAAASFPITAGKVAETVNGETDPVLPRNLKMQVTVKTEDGSVYEIKEWTSAEVAVVPPPESPAPTAPPGSPAPTAPPDSPAPTAPPDSPAPTAPPDSPAPTAPPDGCEDAIGSDSPIPMSITELNRAGTQGDCYDAHVQLTGVVTEVSADLEAGYAPGFWISDPSGGEYSGIYVHMNFDANPVIGHEVQVCGLYNEDYYHCIYYHNCYYYYHLYSEDSTCYKDSGVNDLTPVTLDIAPLETLVPAGNDPCSGASWDWEALTQYLGALVRLPSLTVMTDMDVCGQNSIAEQTNFYYYYDYYYDYYDDYYDFLPNLVVSDDTGRSLLIAFEDEAVSPDSTLQLTGVLGEVVISPNNVIVPALYVREDLTVTPVPEGP